MQWLDAHCHLADPRCAPSVDNLIARSQAVGVDGWLQGGVDPQDWQRQLALAQRHPGVLPAFGLHPWWVASQDATTVEAALRLLEKQIPLAVALGELGLDFSPKRKRAEKLQIETFVAQLRLAKRVAKPLVLHLVHAHSVALPLLRAEGPFPARGLVHGFAASAEIAREYIAMGWVLSVGNRVLHPGPSSLKRALLHIPPENLVIETDAPDGAAGPEGIIAIAQALGTLQGREPGEVLNESSRTLKDLLKVE